jgi:hypothetical protein
MNDPRLTVADQLGGHLDAELALHRRLLASAEMRLKAVVAADHAGLARATLAEEPLVAEAQRLRLVRDRLVRAAAGLCGLPATLTLSDLCAKLPAALGASLIGKGRDLRAVLERLRHIEDHCAAVLRHGVALVRDLLDAVAGVERPARTPYDRRGVAYAASPANRGALVDLRG